MFQRNMFLLISTILLFIISSIECLPFIPVVYPGQEIYTCSKPGYVGLTFDDGLYDYTHKLLDHLKEKNVKATFFITGKNFKCIYDFSDVLIRAVDEGHQIAHHSWSHPGFRSIDEITIYNEIEKLEEVFKKIIGKIPKYFRFPFGERDSRAVEILRVKGYAIVYWDVDSGDTALGVESSLSIYQNLSGPPNSHIILNHDTHETTCNELGPKGIDILQKRGFTLSTIYECMGDSSWWKSSEPPSKKDSSWVC
ncbi:hypothetical protein Glove_326g148 [Diversispora epigaea]|uniref:NodB homology domain-containing protein n=1 Tax=Diversispora epigaea TaxID=1348612 RepID=A0A397HUC8_9GLOM|nr:hypothetical protein Glove_326g148 [Diversispora epigaea]